MKLYVIQVKNDTDISPGNMDKKEAVFIYINMWKGLRLYETWDIRNCEDCSLQLRCCGNNRSYFVGIYLPRVLRIC